MAKKIMCLAFLLCFLGVKSIYAADINDLDESTLKLMDEAGMKALDSVLEKDTLGPDTKNKLSGMRVRQLKETAHVLAVQEAVRWRYQQICGLLEEQSVLLDQIYDFGPLLRNNGKVLPPAISEAGAGFRVDSNQQATSTQQTFYIIRQAKIVTKEPSWRDYLMQSYSSFSEESVQAGVLPKNRKERDIWRTSALRGWEAGINHAERLYATNIAKLTREYKGVVLFNRLALQNMVSLPRLAEGKLGVVVDGDGLSVDERIFRITDQSRFKDVKEWTPKVGH